MKQGDTVVMVDEEYLVNGVDGDSVFLRCVSTGELAEYTRATVQKFADDAAEEKRKAEEYQGPWPIILKTHVQTEKWPFGEELDRMKIPDEIGNEFCYPCGGEFELAFECNSNGTMRLISVDGKKFA